MSKGGGGGELSFADIIERAQRMPEPPAGRSIDAAAPFPESFPGDIKFVDNVDGPSQRAPEYDYEHHTAIFTLPGDEDAYDRLQNDILSGKAFDGKETISFAVQTGEYRVLKTWLVRKTSPGAKRRRDPGEDR